MENHIDWSKIEDVVLDESKTAHIVANPFYTDAIQRFKDLVEISSLSMYGESITESDKGYILKIFFSNTMYKIVFLVTSPKKITILDISAVDIKT